MSIERRPNIIEEYRTFFGFRGIFNLFVKFLKTDRILRFVHTRPCVSCCSFRAFALFNPFWQKVPDLAGVLSHFFVFLSRQQIW